MNRAAREALARKYATMRLLREAHARGEGIAPTATLRALAAEFPGALHEIDRLPPALLDARAAETARCLREPSAEAPWMRRVSAWHALLAAALRAKRDGAHRARDPRSLARELTAASGVTVDEDFARSLAAPAGGRLVPLVLRALAAHLGEDEPTLRASLFPWRD